MTNRCRLISYKQMISTLYKFHQVDLVRLTFLFTKLQQLTGFQILFQRYAAKKSKLCYLSFKGSHILPKSHWRKMYITQITISIFNYQMNYVNNT